MAVSWSALARGASHRDSTRSPSGMRGVNQANLRLVQVGFAPVWHFGIHSRRRASRLGQLAKTNFGASFGISRFPGAVNSDVRAQRQPAVDQLRSCCAGAKTSHTSADALSQDGLEARRVQAVHQTVTVPVELKVGELEAASRGGSKAHLMATATNRSFGGGERLLFRQGSTAKEKQPQASQMPQKRYC